MIMIIIIIFIIIIVVVVVVVVIIDGNMYNIPLDLGSRSQRQMNSESG